MEDDTLDVIPEEGCLAAMDDVTTLPKKLCLSGEMTILNWNCRGLGNL